MSSFLKQFSFSFYRHILRGRRMASDRWVLLFHFLLAALLFPSLNNLIGLELAFFITLLLITYSFFSRFLFVLFLFKRQVFTFDRRFSDGIVEGHFFDYDLIVTNVSSSRTPPFFVRDHAAFPSSLLSFPLNKIKKNVLELDSWPARIRRFFQASSDPLMSYPLSAFRYLHFSADLLSDVMPFEGQVPSLAPGESFTISARTLSFYPGVRQFSGVTASFPDPFFLFQRLFYFKAPQSFVVLPDIVSNRFPLPLHASTSVPLPTTSTLTRQSLHGEEVHSLRPWRSGDSVKRIDWKASARSGSFVTRDYSDSFQPCLGVIFDPTLPPSLSSEFFYQTQRLTRTYLNQIEDARCSFEFLIAQQDHPQHFSSQTLHSHPWLHALARTPSQTAFCPELLNTWIAQHSFSSLCLITTRWTPEHTTWLHQQSFPASSLLVIFIEDESGLVPSSCSSYPLSWDSFL